MNNKIIYIYIKICIIVFLSSCGEGHQDTLFTALDEGDTHVRFNNELTDSPDFNVMKYGYFYNGGGVAAADFNNDGFTDLYFTGNIVPDRLYIHEGGSDISFKDVTADAGLGRSQGWKTGVSVVDINNDGWLDIYVCRSAAESPTLRSNLLYINNGNLTFTESAQKFGLDDMGYSTQAVFFDYDKDGDLDCFILNHSVQKYAGFNQQLASLKKMKDSYYGSRLMRNDGGYFSDVSDEAGMISNVLSFGLGVMVSDYNGDGWADIYVSNDYNEEDYLYINNQNGTFSEQIREATSYTSLFSMGSDAADVNNDGLMDLVTLDMLPESNERIKMTSGDDNYEKYLNLVSSGFHRQYMRNMLQLNTGNNPGVKTPEGRDIPLFQEVGQISGISNTDWSWAALFADFDLDGHKDLFVTNGYEKDYTNMDFLNYTVALQTRIQSGGEKLNELDVISKMPSIREHNYMFKNKGTAIFEDFSKEWGMGSTTVSAGAAYADLDNDGDLDLVVNNLNAPAGIFRNNTKNSGSSLRISLKSDKYASVIGASVKIYTGIQLQVQEYMPVRGFQSSSAGPMVFGLGNAAQADSILVYWADGTQQKIEGPVRSGALIIEQKSTTQRKLSQSTPPKFQINNIPFTYASTDVNDFKLQPLLPYMLSSPGPEMAIRTDKKMVYITGVRGKGGQLFTINGEKLTPRPGGMGSPLPLADEADAVFTDVDSDGDEDLIIAYTDYQGNAGQQALIPRLFLSDGAGYVMSPGAFQDTEGISAGAIAVWDYNGDGAPDIFIGSRVKPGSYPESGLSIIYTNMGSGNFKVSIPQHKFDVGMVTDAAAADMNGDGKEELVLSRDFGTVAILESRDGDIKTDAIQDISATGCWNRILIDDFNADGRPDVFAGNMGLNNQLSVVSEDGLLLHAYTYFGIAKAIPVIAVSEGNAWYPFAARDELMSQVPILKKKYNDYTSYAKADVNDVFGEDWSKASKRSAKTLKTALFVQNKSGFEEIQLPEQVQYSSVYAITAVDINVDGIKDIVLGGNNIKTRVRIGDINSSFGTILTGRAGGKFEYGGEIGIPGELRSLQSIKGGRGEYLLAGFRNMTSKLISWNQ